MCIYRVFWTFGVLVLARGALRDLRYFSWTNNLRIVKSFLEITDEALIPKMWNFKNHQFSCNFLAFYSNYIYIECFWTFDVLVLARGALRDLRYFFSANHLRIVKSFCEIRDEALIAKIQIFQNHMFSCDFRGILLQSHVYIGYF